VAEPNTPSAVRAFDDHERRQWAGRAAAYTRSFGPLCAYPGNLVLDAAGVRAGTRLLDVGTGPGTLAGLAAGRGAAVTAVDAEAGMVAAARRAVPSADVRQATLPDLPFPDAAFDAVVANFVINHVGDPAAAMRELARVGRPGGRIAVTIWPYPAPALQRLWGEAFTASGVPRRADLPALDAARDFPRTEAGLAGLLGALADVRVRTVAWVHRTDPEDWWSGPANGIGSFAVLLEGQPPAALTRIRAEYDRLAATYRQADGLLALPTAALLASGSVA
jgi:SAM-dependent methyltransferase